MAKNPVDMYKVIHMKTDDIFFFTVYLLQKMYAKILSLSIFKKRKSLNIKKSGENKWLTTILEFFR